MKIISIINQKGGVGKTTTAANLGSFLSNHGKVLLIDVDKQGNLSSNFSVEVTEKSNVYNLFTKLEVIPTKINEELYLIPSDQDMAGIEFTIQNVLARETILKKALENHFKDAFDFIIIDCPPDMNLVTINALSASSGLIIPVNMDYFGFRGIGVMIDFIHSLRDTINNDLVVYGILITSYDERLKMSKQILQEFNEKEYDAALFNSKIRKATAISQSQLAKKTIFEYDPASNGAIDYAEFGKELLSKLNLN